MTGAPFIIVGERVQKLPGYRRREGTHIGIQRETDILAPFIRTDHLLAAERIQGVHIEPDIGRVDIVLFRVGILVVVGADVHVKGLVFPDLRIGDRRVEYVLKNYAGAVGHRRIELLPAFTLALKLTPGRAFAIRTVRPADIEIPCAGFIQVTQVLDIEARFLVFVSLEIPRADIGRPSAIRVQGPRRITSHLSLSTL